MIGNHVERYVSAFLSGMCKSKPHLDAIYHWSSYTSNTIFIVSDADKNMEQVELFCVAGRNIWQNNYFEESLAILPCARYLPKKNETIGPWRDLCPNAYSNFTQNKSQTIEWICIVIASYQ